MKLIDLGPGVTALFTTRDHGVSTGPWQGLNLAATVGDDPAAVHENRSFVAEQIGAPLRGMHQVHGSQVAEVRAVDVAAPPPQADALVTVATDVALTVLVADCIPLLLADSRAGVVGAVHAGRRGVELNIARETVEKMCALGAAPHRIHAVVGPAICGNCYEVPLEMQRAFTARIPQAASQTSWNTPGLDLPGALAWQLAQVDVAHVQNLALCTYEDPAFFSYRRNRITGRFAGVIRLKR